MRAFANLPPVKEAAIDGAGESIASLFASRRPAPRPGAQVCSGKSTGNSAARMRVLITGMAPIKQDVAKFFDLMQLPLCESYGLVETGSLTYRAGGLQKYGSVGKPLRGVKFAIRATMAKSSSSAKNSLTRRYFQSAEGENERTFLGNNRIATGDIGRLDRDGYLYLLGRKKELIITPGRLQDSSRNRGAGIGRLPRHRPGGGVPQAGRGDADLRGKPHRSAGRGSPCPRARLRQDDEEHQAVPDRRDHLHGCALFRRERMLRPNLKLDRRAIAAKFNLS